MCFVLLLFLFLSVVVVVVLVDVIVCLFVYLFVYFVVVYGQLTEKEYKDKRKDALDLGRNEYNTDDNLVNLAN